MPAKPKKTRRRPLKRAKLGGVTVTVQRLGGGERFAVLVHKPDGTRSKKEFATQAEALTAFDKRTAEAARLGVAAAASVEDDEIRALSDFKSKTADWHPRPSVAAALAEYMERHGKNRQSITFSEALARRLDEAKARGTTERHRINVKSRVRDFVAKYGETAVADITGEMVSDFIDAMPVSARSRADTLNDISGVFAAAVRARKLERNPAEAIRPPKTVAPETGVITAAEFSRLLAALPARSVPAVAIMGLAGLRRAEAEKLTWGNVRFDSGTIIVSAGVAKTGARRTVPITPSLAAWLALHKKDAGPVAPPAMTFRRDLEAARVAAEIRDWPRNALRHAAASAWVAIEADIARVGAWMGHAPAVLHRHYKSLISEAEAREWFSVAPPAPATKPAKPRKRPAKADTAPPPSADTPEEPEAASVKIIAFPRAAS